MKRCTRCKKIKNYDEFCKKSASLDGLNRWCKNCEAEYKKQFKEKNPEKVNKWKRDWEKNNREKYLKNKREMYHTEKHKKTRQEYILKNKHQIYESQKSYKEANKKHLKEYDRHWRKKKYREDENFRIKINLRNRLNSFLKSNKIKSSKAYGVDFVEIIGSLGDRPGPGFEIDHIFPCVAFDHMDDFHVWACWHPDNFQWLTKTNNCKKSCKYDINEFKKYLDEKFEEYERLK